MTTQEKILKLGYNVIDLPHSITITESYTSDVTGKKKQIEIAELISCKEISQSKKDKFLFNFYQTLNN